LNRRRGAVELTGSRAAHGGSLPIRPVPSDLGRPLPGRENNLSPAAGRSRRANVPPPLPNPAPSAIHPLVQPERRHGARPGRQHHPRGGVSVQPTDVSNPRYYHKVVDCQWACPAHTNVPEYIRLIAQGRYGDAYMLNRESNVFPGILGRTCDRPCEPACRRTRVDGQPVAICRLKRVAADLREDISDRLPRAPAEKNGKRIALVGCGPASLTVCNDLAPLGYDCTIYEKLDRSGGLMRTNIPAFRLPPEVLDEEVDAIIDLGVNVLYDTPVTSMKWLLEQGYDAVFVGSGAPKGKELDIPGRWDAKGNIHIGIEWLEAVHFGHVDRIGERVLIIGVGNTAMDCCRTSKRLGGKDVKVMA